MGIKDQLTPTISGGGEQGTAKPEATSTGGKLDETVPTQSGSLGSTSPSALGARAKPKAPLVAASAPASSTAPSERSLPGGGLRYTGLSSERVPNGTNKPATAAAKASAGAGYPQSNFSQGSSRWTGAQSTSVARPGGTAGSPSLGAPGAPQQRSQLATSATSAGSPSTTVGPARGVDGLSRTVGTGPPAYPGSLVQQGTVQDKYPMRTSMPPPSQGMRVPYRR